MFSISNPPARGSSRECAPRLCRFYKNRWDVRTLPSSNESSIVLMRGIEEIRKKILVIDKEIELELTH